MASQTSLKKTETICLTCEKKLLKPKYFCSNKCQDCFNKAKYTLMEAIREVKAYQEEHFCLNSTCQRIIPADDEKVFCNVDCRIAYWETYKELYKIN
jgi:predicted nucleic acid-binding Zn ribbon protein